MSPDIFWKKITHPIHGRGRVIGYRQFDRRRLLAIRFDIADDRHHSCHGQCEMWHGKYMDEKTVRRLLDNMGYKDLIL